MMSGTAPVAVDELMPPATDSYNGLGAMMPVIKDVTATREGVTPAGIEQWDASMEWTYISQPKHLLKVCPPYFFGLSTAFSKFA